MFVAVVARLDAGTDTSRRGRPSAALFGVIRDRHVICKPTCETLIAGPPPRTRGSRRRHQQQQQQADRPRRSRILVVTGLPYLEQNDLSGIAKHKPAFRELEPVFRDAVAARCYERRPSMSMSRGRAPTCTSWICSARQQATAGCRRSLTARRGISDTLAFARGCREKAWRFRCGWARGGGRAPPARDCPRSAGRGGDLVAVELCEVVGGSGDQSPFG